MSSLSLRLQYNMDAYADMVSPLFFWRRPSWSIDQIPNMTGKVVLVTGGDSGTGYCTSSALYRSGAKGYLACRNESKAGMAIDRIEYGLPCEGAYVKPKGKLVFIQLDLEDLNSVVAAAKHILESEQRLDILYANAGIMMSPPGMYTKQGYSLQFGTNVLGHHRLITLLLPLLQKTSLAHPESPARVVILSSAGHFVAPKGGVDCGVLCRPEEGDTMSARKLAPLVDYGMSKWGDLAFAQYVHDHYGPGSGNKDGEILTTAIHPGVVKTNISAALEGLIGKIIVASVAMIAVPPETGTINQLWAGTTSVQEAREVSGKYIVPHTRTAIPRPDLYNREAVERMWNWCEQEGRKHA